MVAAAFDSLLSNEEVAGTGTTATTTALPVKADDLDERIINAKTVSALLSVGESTTAVTRKHALKVKKKWANPLMKFFIIYL